jgi:hypothetical protein
VESNSPVCDHLRKCGFYSCFEVQPPVNVTDDSITEASIADMENESVSQASHLDGSSIRPIVQFVSHHNHQSEDVGVDHIFVKPDNPWSSVSLRLQQWHAIKCDKYALTDCDLSTPVDSIVPIPFPSSINETRNHCDFFQLQTSAFRSLQYSRIDLNELQDQFGAHNQNNTKLTNRQYKNFMVAQDSVFVDTCAVLPRKLHCKNWSEQFKISDHRPVSAKLVFGHKKSY